MYQRFMYDHVRKNYLHKHVFYWETGLERRKGRVRSPRDANAVSWFELDIFPID